MTTQVTDEELLDVALIGTLIKEATGPLQIYKRKTKDDYCVIAGSVGKNEKRFYDKSLFFALMDAKHHNGGKL